MRLQILIGSIILFSITSSIAQSWEQVHNLILTCHTQGQYSKALEFEDIYLKLAEEEFGKENGNYGVALNTLAVLHDEVRNYTRALLLSEASVKNAIDFIGKDHPSYGVRISTLASINESMGNFHEAQLLLEEALENARWVDTLEYGSRLNDLAKLYQIRGDYGNALTSYQNALLHIKHSRGIAHPEYGRCLGNLASLYQELAQFPKALVFHKKALANAENAFTKEHPNYLVVLANVAGFYEETGNFSEAIKLYNLALSSVLEHHGKEHSHYGLILTLLANCEKKKGAYQLAISYYEQAMENVAGVTGIYHVDYINILNRVSSLFKELGGYGDALMFSEEALRCADSIAGDHSALHALQSNELGTIYQKMGAYPEALKMHIESLQIIEQLYGSKHSAYRSTLKGLALTLAEMGEYAKAEELYNDVLKKTAEVYGKKHQSYCRVLNEMTLFYTNCGQFSKALLTSQTALSTTRDAFGEEHPQTTAYLNNHADLLRRMGNYTEAIRLSTDALEITANTIGKDNIGYIMQLNNLAVTLREVNAYDYAIPVYQEVMSIADTLLEENSFHYATLYGNLAVLYAAQGDHNEAYFMHDRARSIKKTTLGMDHSSYIISLNGMALACAYTGDYHEAKKLFSQALDDAKKSIGKRHPLYHTVLSNMSIILADNGDYNDAVNLALICNQLTKEQIANQFSFMASNEKELYFQTLSSQFHILQSVNRSSMNYSNALNTTSYNNELVLKDLILNSGINTENDIFSKGSHIDILLYQEWRKAKKRIIAQYSLPQNQQSKNLKQWESTADSLERELVRRSSAFAKERQKKDITWQQVETQIQPNEVAIEFSHFDYYNKGWTDSTLYVAYLLRKDSEYPEMVYLFEERQLDSLANNATPDVLYSRSGGFKAVNRGLHNKGKDLYDLIWKNLEPHLEGIETIYFAPSGKLHQIAFAALADSSGQLLSEKYQLVQMSSTGKLVVPDPEPEKAPALIMGGIHYEYDTTSGAPIDGFVQVYNPVNLVYQSNDTLTRSSRGETWQYLDGTRREAHSIYRLYKGQKQAITMVSQTDATEAYVKSLDGNSPKMLHLATHGFFFEDPEDKHQDMSFMGNQPIYTLADDPLMRSGLVLAGANYAWKHGQNPYEEEDGILTAYEISNLNLSNTDLVVLSACETGLGDIEGSEGVYGLQRAFRMAGVEYIIMSLWQVPDNETSEFMKLFYKTWLSGDEGIYEAFRHTQRIMADEYRDEPQKWAGFVLVQ